MILDKLFVFAQQHKKIACANIKDRGILLSINYIFASSMESTSSSSGSSQHVSSKKLAQHDDLPPTLKKLQSFAKSKYSFLKELARKSDDAQMEFTSAGFHYVLGSELTAQIALRSAREGDTQPQG